MNIFKKIFKKKEEQETPLAIRALTTLQQGKYQEALSLLNEYIKTEIESSKLPLDSDDGLMYYNRSIAKEALNDRSGAISDLRKCISISESHHAYFKLADLQSQTSKKLDVDNLIRAYELGSTDAEKSLRQYTNYFNQ